MKYILWAALLALSFTASAGNDNANPCGNNGNNCGSTANGGAGGNGYGGTGGDAAAIAVGLGLGGSAQGGQGGDGGAGGSSTAFGGAGGSVRDAGNSHNLNVLKGGDQSNVGINGQSLDNKVNVGAVGTGNSTSVGRGGDTSVTVGGDSTLVERNAPPVFLGNLTATMSCAGSFNAGGSDRNGSGAFGFTWISADCRTVVIGKEFVSIGMPDVACRVWKTTKGFKRAVKADPSLANVDCTVNPVADPKPPVSFLEARTPRG